MAFWKQFIIIDKNQSSAYELIFKKLFEVPHLAHKSSTQGFQFLACNLKCGNQFI